MGVYLGILHLLSVLGIFHVLAIGTFGLTPLEAGMGLLMLWVPIYGVWLGKPFIVPRRWETTALVSVWAVMTVGCLGPLLSADTTFIMQSVKTHAHFTYLWLFCFIMYCMPISAADIVKGYRFHFGVSILVMLFAIYQLPARALDLPGGWLEIMNVSFQRVNEETEFQQLALRFADFYRATSIFTEPSSLAIYSSYSLVMLVLPYVRNSPHIVRRAWLRIFIMIITLLGLFLAFSLTGLMLVGVAFILILFLYRGIAWKRFGTILVVSAVILFCTDLVVTQYSGVSVLGLFGARLESILTGQAAAGEGSTIVGESLTQRTGDYEASWEVWKEHPWLGTGPGNFGNSTFGRYHNAAFPSTSYGSVLAELGVVGLFVFVVFLVGLFVRMLMDERKWTVGHRGEDSDLERLVPSLPFRALLLIFVCFNGNNLVTANFWFEVILMLAVQNALHRATGVDRSRQIFLVRKPWRDIVSAPRSDHDTGRIGQVNGSAHRR